MVEIKEMTDEVPDVVCSGSAQETEEKPANKRPNCTTMEGMICNGMLEGGVYA